MDKKEIIENIKNLLKFNTTDETPVNTEVEVKFLDVTDTDGNVLRVDTEELAVGEVLRVVTESGEDLTPDAEYKLEDGRIIKTDADSKIIEIIEDDKEEVVEEEMSDEVTEEMSEVTDTEVVEEVIENENETEDTEENGSDIESRIVSLENTIKEMITNQNTLQEASMSIVKMVEKFGGTPVEEDVEDIKSTFSSEIKNKNESNIDDRLKSIREIRMNNNKK